MEFKDTTVQPKGYLASCNQLDVTRGLKRSGERCNPLPKLTLVKFSSHRVPSQGGFGAASSWMLLGVEAAGPWLRRDGVGVRSGG